MEYDFESTKSLLSHGPVPEISDHRAVLAAKYDGAPQKAKAVDMALSGIEVLLGDLARHGHFYKLVEAESTAPQEFPQMLYQDDGKQLTVETQGEKEIALGAGWFEHPTERPQPDEPVAEPSVGSEAERQLPNMETSGIPGPTPGGDVPPVVLDPPEHTDTPAPPVPSGETN